MYTKSGFLCGLKSRPDEAWFEAHLITRDEFHPEPGEGFLAKLTQGQIHRAQPAKVWPCRAVDVIHHVPYVFRSKARERFSLRDNVADILVVLLEGAFLV